MNAVPREAAVIYYPGYSQETVQENLQWKTIASITQANPCVLTTNYHHNYPAGSRVRFQIPSMFGMVQLNDKEVKILSVTSNTLTVNLDSTNYTPFAYPSPLPQAYTPPVVIPDASGAYLPPLPLPFGNQDSFEGVIYNNGGLGNPINGM
jgi:hypothetical protein